MSGCDVSNGVDELRGVERTAWKEGEDAVREAEGCAGG